jgi:hypothetical protein
MSEIAEQEPHFRLLVCRNCGTIEELPGANEDPGDQLLDISVERHGESHYGILWNVPKGIWMAPQMRQAVIDQINDKVGTAGQGLGVKFYEAKSQFHEDAMTCYSLHNRPQGQCTDYKTPKKRLSPKTEADRRAAGLPVADAPKVFLCDFCPVKSFNMMKAHDASGLSS